MFSAELSQFILNLVTLTNKASISASICAYPLPGVGCEDVALELVPLGRHRRRLPQLGLRVVVTDVVTDSDELRLAVAAGQQHHRHPHQVSRRDLLGVGRVGLSHRGAVPIVTRITVI